MVFPVVIYGCESWTIKKAGCRRIEAFELWCWRRLLRVPWTARRSNQSILKEVSPEYSLEGLMLKLKLQLDGHEFEQAPGFVDGQGSLVCCSPWGFKESDRTVTEPNDWFISLCMSSSFIHAVACVRIAYILGREQDGEVAGGCGVPLSPWIHQEHTFRRRSACRTPAESRQKDRTSRK